MPTLAVVHVLRPVPGCLMFVCVQVVGAIAFLGSLLWAGFVYLVTALVLRSKVREGDAATTTPSGTML
jgi:hypothetical protein